ncbi:DNA-binding protein [Aurantiacibacter zhengii]|uniref:DNA-binding protein n=1 Tax=Aurantiacibacter zhengii TaxID=2307003 RepID=A0A418NND5_9SPHN|nr:DNA-binding protein [Aurantiacibacter zhengii]
MQTTEHDSAMDVGPLWLTEKQTAQRLHMSQKWLQKTRIVGGGPRFAKFGSTVRYSLADIKAYEQNCLRLSTSDVGDAR